MIEAGSPNWLKLSPGFRRTHNRRCRVRDLKAQITALTQRVASARVIAQALVAKEKEQPMAGGKFFALIDEIAQSEERLDKLAEPLLNRLPQLEERAKRAIEGKHAKLDAAADYLERLEGKIEQMEDNGGPPLSDGSSAPSAKPTGS